MDTTQRWISEPTDAYRDWQQTEATGSDRRPFSARSIVQHAAMFDRLHRHLLSRRVTVATFGEAELDSFFNDVDNRCAPGTTTRLRYAKLVDRLCRHLIELGLRTRNPAAAHLLHEAWPDNEPVPLFLGPHDDARLQAFVQLVPSDHRDLRECAIAALLAGTGITAAEIRGAQRSHLTVDGARPHVVVPKHGARAERTVLLPAFALPALSSWLDRAPAPANIDLLFPSPRSGTVMNDWMLGLAVRNVLSAISFTAPDMSPRVLRNTFARRLLLTGRSNQDVSVLLGLSSQRTVVRLRATIDTPAGSSCPEFAGGLVA